MSTHTEVPRGNALMDEPQALGTGPIVAATDGTAQSVPALHAAVALAESSHSEMVIVSVVEPLEVVAADYGVLLPPTDTEAQRRQAARQIVTDQAARVIGDAVRWKIELRSGDAPNEIASAAREANARLIVLGLGHHDVLDRLFGGETALRTLRAARTPVFMVGETFTGLPKRVVIATDFTQTSVLAARVAFQLFESIASVHVVHVAPRLEVQPEAFGSWMSLYGEDVAPAFERFKAEIGAPSHATIETFTLQGRPAREIVQFARSAGADLIVTGSRAGGLLNRLLVGSTATGLVRAAQCAVLAVPAPRQQASAALEQPGAAIPQAQWSAELSAFTKRNQGRRAALEVDDPEIGAQAQEHDYPLLGVAYDHHDERVEIMLGDFEGIGRHLTRGISNVRSIDILRDDHGRDWILRVAHGDGQTVLTLQR